MPRIRVSTTVDSILLATARARRPGVTTAVLIDAALVALIARERTAEIDASYERYDERPLSEPDEWGSIAAFRDGASRT